MSRTRNDNHTTTRTSNMNRIVVPVNLIEVVRRNNVKEVTTDDASSSENPANSNPDSNLWNTRFQINVEDVNRFDIPKHIPTKVVQRELPQRFHISDGKIYHLHTDSVRQDAELVRSFSTHDHHDGNNQSKCMPFDVCDQNASSGAFVVCENEVHEIVSMQELEQHGDRNWISKEDISIPCPKAQLDNRKQLHMDAIHRDTTVHPVGAVSTLDLLKHDENWAVVSEFHSIEHNQNIHTVVDNAASLDNQVLGVTEKRCKKHVSASKYHAVVEKAGSLDNQVLGVTEKKRCKKHVSASKYTVVDKAGSLDNQVLGVTEKKRCKKHLSASKHSENSPKQIKISELRRPHRIWSFKEYSPKKASQLPKETVLPSNRKTGSLTEQPSSQLPKQTVLPSNRKTGSLTEQPSPGGAIHCKAPNICQDGNFSSIHNDVIYLQVPTFFSLVDRPVFHETNGELVDTSVHTETRDPETTADDDAELELESIDDAHNKRRNLLEEMSVLLAKMQGNSGLDATAEPSNTELEKQLPCEVSEVQDNIEPVAICMKKEPLDSNISQHAEVINASSASPQHDVNLVSIKQEPVSDDDLSYVGGMPEMPLETLPGHVDCDMEQADKLLVKEELLENTNQTVDRQSEPKPCKLERGLFELFSKEFPAQDKDQDAKNEKQKVVESCPTVNMQVTSEGHLSKENVCVPNECTEAVQIPFDDLSKDKHSMCSMQKVLLEQCTKADGSHHVKLPDKTEKLTINGQHVKSDEMTCKQKQMAKVRSAKRKGLAQDQKCLSKELKGLAQGQEGLARDRKGLAQDRKSLAQERGKTAKKDGHVSRQIKELLQLCSEADEFSQQKGIGSEGCSKRKRRRLTKREEPLHMSFGVRTKRKASEGGLVAEADQNGSNRHVNQALAKSKCPIDEIHEVKSKPKNDPQIIDPVSPGHQERTNKQCAIDEQHETVKLAGNKPKSEPQIKQLVIRLENISEHPLAYGSGQNFVKGEEEKQLMKASIEAQRTPDSKNCVVENYVTRKKAGRVSRQIQELLDICAEAEEFIDQDPTSEEVPAGLSKRKSRRSSKQNQPLSSSSSPKPNSEPMSCKEAKSSKPKSGNQTGIVHLEAKVIDDTVMQEHKQVEDISFQDSTSIFKKRGTSNYKLLIEVTKKRKGKNRASSPTSELKKVQPVFGARANDSKTCNSRSKNNGNKNQKASVEKTGGHEHKKHPDYTQMGERMDKDSQNVISSEDASDPEVRHTAAFISEEEESEVCVLENAPLSVDDRNREFCGSTERELPLCKNKKPSIQKTGDQAISQCDVNTVSSLSTPCNENVGLKTCVHQVNNSVDSKYLDRLHTTSICKGNVVSDQVVSFVGHSRFDTIDEQDELVKDRRIVVGDKRVVHEVGVYMNHHTFPPYKTNVAQVSKDCDKAIVVSDYEDISDDNDVICLSKDVVSVYDDISDDEVCVGDDCQIKIDLSGKIRTNPSSSYDDISEDEYFKGDSDNSPILADGDNLYMYNDSKFKGMSPLQEKLGFDQRIVPKNLDETVLDDKSMSCCTVLMERNSPTIDKCDVPGHSDKLKLENMDYKCDICPWRCGNANRAVKHRLGHALHRLTISCHLSQPS